MFPRLKDFQEKMKNMTKQLSELTASNYFTKDQMMTGANHAMVMLQDTYSLDIGELANGKLVSESFHLNHMDFFSSANKDTIEVEETLTASDLTTLASAAFDMRFLDTAIKFLRYASRMLGRYQASCTVNKY